MRVHITAWGIVAILAAGLPAHHAGQTQATGANPPPTALVGHSLHPLISNQWYSTAIFSFPSQPIYALPLAFRLTPNGLGFSAPDIHRTPNTIFAGYQEDFAIGCPQPFTGSEVTRVGDWSVGLTLPTAASCSLAFTLVHGAPFTVLHAPHADLRLSFRTTYRVLSDTLSGSQSRYHAAEGKSAAQLRRVLAFQTSGHSYLLVPDAGASVQLQTGEILLAHATRVYLALLDSPKHLTKFAAAARSEITDTHFTFHPWRHQLLISFQLATAGRGLPLLALYPHQYNNLFTRETFVGGYATLRGPLRLISADRFAIGIPLMTPPMSFPRLRPVSAPLKDQLQRDIASYLTDTPPGAGDYAIGKWLGKGASLLELAETEGLLPEAGRLLAFLEPAFGRAMDQFSYQSDRTSMIAGDPDFGSERLNDHHLQYGYYIRTAAVLASYDPAALAVFRDRVDALVSDIATTDRTSATFPFLRTFDVYESHSWADGEGNFADGNDQESSSEAIQAWYAVYLWSRVTDDRRLMSWALFLYSSEILGTRYYWFDVKGLYHAPYAHRIASIVWGGKVDFATWFSPQTNMIYGIQLLPFTAGSTYLDTLLHFGRYDADYYASGGADSQPWSDLFWMWRSYYHPSLATRAERSIEGVEAGSSRSLFRYWIDCNAQPNCKRRLNRR
jgi:endoglucanase Acf2